MESGKDDILNMYKEYDIFVYSATYCPYCDEAKNIAEGIKGINSGSIELDELPDDSVKQALIAKTG